MVLVKAMLESLLLFLLLLTSSVSVHSVAGEAARKNNVAKSYRSWRRINHGSARGPPKHLVNPTVEHTFEVPSWEAFNKESRVVYGMKNWWKEAAPKTSPTGDECSSI
ncbi:hypothetical protein SADUNF_Sadunf01G0109700 [Salix dunnii]|uniref:Uncharacterized protein n=1 Tax=Salix dunnii TaxID=1413687 RepID=A0A835NBF6_9ROSI|nr:hypothetical protein SADUNF_Sadunf01G0109700 [Salix dunnii]